MPLLKDFQHRRSDESEVNSMESEIQLASGSNLGRHLLWLVVAKIVVLTAIYIVCFRPFPRPDASPAHVLERLAPPSSPTGNSHD
jgi:hypothetical protein